MAIEIEIQGFAEPPKPEVVKGLIGQVFHVLVGGTVEPEGTPFGEFFRFARVLDVRQKNSLLTTLICERCQEATAHEIHVEWESEYISSDGDVLCENCVDGIVVQGAASIAFGGKQHPYEGYGISIVMRLVD
jgi:hypothetical protein